MCEHCTEFLSFVIICIILTFDVMLFNSRYCVQGGRGLFTSHVDGKTHEFMFSTRDDVWRKRRHTLSPAFSAHKMKLVGEGNATVQCIHRNVQCA